MAVAGTGIIIKFFTWQTAFYVQGITMVAISIIWVILVDPKPEDGINPRTGLKRMKIEYGDKIVLLLCTRYPSKI